MKTERIIMNQLADAWNEFMMLSKEKNDHGKMKVDQDDLNDFRKAIHDAQRIIATIAAQNEIPNLFL